MSNAPWMNKEGDKIEVAPIVAVKPNKYILVTCRAIASNEAKILSKNFKAIMSYNPTLNSGNLDLNNMPFDMLIIDVSNKDSHLFLEIISPQAKALNIPIIVLKRKASNYKLLVEALEAYVISKIEDLEGENFLNFLVKNKLPKLDSTCLNLLKGCFTLLSKQ